MSLHDSYALAVSRVTPRGKVLKHPLVHPFRLPSFIISRRAIVRLLLGVAALAAPSSAFADCGHDIIDQAYKGKITKHYSQACYNTAIRIEPVDGSSYSDIDSIIRAAKRADALRERDAAVASQPVTSSDSPRTPQSHKPPVATTEPAPPGTALVGGGRDYSSNVVPASGGGTTNGEETTLLGAPSATPVLDHLAPAHADDLPVVVIVLGVLATLLVLAGVAGALLRRRAGRSNS
jgi:hypothetical protein